MTTTGSTQAATPGPRLEPSLPFSLGPFRLTESLGSGGWGLVYGGVYRSAGRLLPVAVKVLRASRRPGSLGRQALEREIEAVAALDHPHVVRILDQRRVTRADAAATGLGYGDPYLAMELLTGGTLSDKCGRVPWATQRRILLGLLDALAHAHARGLVHRDLKPSNVLVGDGRIKLADFGLAQRATPSPATKGDVLGTPGFMAPEQLRGDARGIGPWTDLYALGCLAAQLATGRPVFPRGENADETLLLQLTTDPAPLRPTHPVPDGLEAWVDTLLRLEPTSRFQRAADAAEALRALGEPVASSAPPRPPPGPVPSSEEETAVLSSTSGVPGIASPAPPPATPPADWRAPRPDEARHVIDDGLRLFGLRRPPVVGREPQQDLLWAALASVATEGSPRAVVLRGVSGVGKTTLARWLVERAEETGAARARTTRHQPHDAAGEGIVALLQEHFRCQGRPEPEVRALLLRDSALADAPMEELEDLARLLAGEPPDARSLRASAREALQRAARPRPLVLAFDDAQFAPDALAFVAHLLDAADAPILAVVTVEETALAQRPAAGAALADLLTRDAATALPVEALSDADQRVLVESMLGLSGRAVDRIVSRTGGSPLFAVELIHACLRQGLLTPGTGGLSVPVDAPLPDDLQTAWGARVHRLLDGLPAGAEQALELGAALGTVVRHAEWTPLVDRRAADGLLRRMTRQGLARRRADGWSFAHGLLREAVVARAGARMANRHRVCADALASAHPHRRGLHLLAARRPDEAVDALVEATEASRSRSDVASLDAQLEALEQALRASARPETDPAWAWLWAIRRGRRQFRGDLEGSLRCVEELDGLADRTGSPSLRASAQAARAEWLIAQGKLRQAIELAEAAAAGARAIDAITPPPRRSPSRSWSSAAAAASATWSRSPSSGWARPTACRATTPRRSVATAAASP